MKCPVCKSNQLDSVEMCGVCGFSQLQRTFVSEVDAEEWMDNVVVPCREVWEHAQFLLDVTKTELENCRSLYIQKLEEHLELLKAYNTLLEFQATMLSDKRDGQEVMDEVDYAEDEDVADEELPF